MGPAVGSDARKRPGALAGAPITQAIILVNLAIFVGEVLAAGSFDALNEVPRAVSLRLGADYAPLTLGLGQYERLVTCCFLHGGLMHVALNMWSLGQIGPFAERTVGSARYAVLYVATGIAGSVASLLWGLLREELPLSVGASGAICGVMGASLVLGVRLEGWRSEIARQIGFWLIVVVVYGAIRAHVDNAAHVGGLVVGCIIAALWRRGIRYSPTATFVAIGLSAGICIASGAMVLWRAATDPYAHLGLQDRVEGANAALDDRDCPRARTFVAAVQKIAPGGDELKNLRLRASRECPRIDVRGAE